MRCFLLAAALAAACSSYSHVVIHENRSTHSAWDGYELHARRARSASEIEVAVGRELRGDDRAEAFARLAARPDLGADARALLDLERDRGY